jgi:signal transduction histidine kinase
MEALGSLVGGIAHDFNNTLGGIVGAVSLMKACLDTDDGSKPLDFTRELEIISRSTQRAAATVRGLMAFASNTPQRNEPFRLDDTLRHIADFAGRTLDRAAHVVVDVTSDEATVIGDAPQVEQLILNLVINAEHAVTFMRPVGAVKGGTISLSLRSQDPEDDFTVDHPKIAPVRYWALSVSDDGVGMDQHTLARAFDPFFTTKATDLGSGLGLSMAHLIARQHGGFIEGRSEPGCGSTFTVYLPAASVSVAPVAS